MYAHPTGGSVVVRMHVLGETMTKGVEPLALTNRSVGGDDSERGGSLSATQQVVFTA